MANPSLKKGYLSIANELSERFAQTSLKGEEWRILWVVLRQTWGWKEGDRKKDWDWISLSQFEEKTGMKRANVARTLKSLVAHRLLDKELTGKKRYKFNQDYDQWVVAHKLPSSVQATFTSSVQATENSSSQATHNRNIKETLKSIAPEAPSPGLHGSPEVPPAFDQMAALEKLGQAKSRTHRVAGYLMLRKGNVYENKEQFNLAFGRALKPAKELTGYSRHQIDLAIESTKIQAAELGFDWKLETVVKNIERVANQPTREPLTEEMLRTRAFAKELGYELEEI
jgi:phage replication O-like protein O